MKARGLRVVHERILAQEPGRYISFPDVVRTRSGKLICGFREADCHYPPRSPVTELVLLDSDDEGQTWHNRRIFAHYPRDHERWAWHCVRFSTLADGRIALLCDLAGPGFGPPVTHVSWSSDDGQTWTPPIDTGIVGIVPDRMIELDARSWGFTSHWFTDNERGLFFQRFYTSEDEGKSWRERSMIATDPVLKFCEASVIRHPSGELVAYLRENSFLHAPTYTTRSLDAGFTWSKPEPLPFAGHRPCAGLLDDTTVLVTYRNVGGNPGLFGWIGSTTETGWVPTGKDLAGDGARMLEEGLRIDTRGGEWEGVEYNLHPMLDWNTELTLTARVRRIDGGPKSCVVRGAGYLRILEGRVRFDHIPDRHHPDQVQCFGEIELDTETFHDYAIHYDPDRRRIAVTIDGIERIVGEAGPDPSYWQRKVAFGNQSENPTSTVRFTDHAGASLWAAVALELKPPAAAPIAWRWEARSGAFPNHSERERCVEIYPETGRIWGHAGYSGWVSLGPRSAYCVDYRMNEAEMPYVVGYRLEFDD